MTFRAMVYAVVRRIPRGEVATYGQVALLAGRARAARAVGGAMRRCPDGVPWHRVVNAQGRVSRRRSEGGMLTQRIRLEHEGVRFHRGHVPLFRYQWQPAARSLPARRRAGPPGTRVGDRRAAAPVGATPRGARPAATRRDAPQARCSWR